MTYFEFTSSVERTHYIHKLWVHGKYDYSQMSSADADFHKLPRMRKELVVMFDTGSPIDIVDSDVGLEFLVEIPISGSYHIMGKVTDSNIGYYGEIIIDEKSLNCDFHSTQLRSNMIVDGLHVDAIIGLPTMQKWRVVFYSTDGSIAIKVLDPIAISVYKV
jgi:hypothetical protein